MHPEASRAGKLREKAVQKKLLVQQKRQSTKFSIDPAKSSIHGVGIQSLIDKIASKPANTSLATR